MSESVDQILGEFRGFNIGENGAKAALSPGGQPEKKHSRCTCDECDRERPRQDGPAAGPGGA